MWKGKLVLALVSVGAVCAAPSCGAADDVIRVFGKEIGLVDDVAKGVPKSRLPGAVTTTGEAVQTEINSMMAVLKGETDAPSAKQSANAACIASDLGDINSMESAVDFAVQQTSTPYGRRRSVEELALELDRAESSGDQAQVLAAAAICRWAG